MNDDLKEKLAQQLGVDPDSIHELQMGSGPTHLCDCEILIEGAERDIKILLRDVAAIDGCSHQVQFRDVEGAPMLIVNPERMIYILISNKRPIPDQEIKAPQRKDRH